MNTTLHKTKRFILPLILILIVAVVAIRLKTNKANAQKKVYHYNKEQAQLVRADTLKLENINTEYSYSGIFDPNKETRVSAEVQGKIHAVYVDVGSSVNKNQPIIQLDNSVLNLQLQAIEVQIEGLDADVNRYTVLANADVIQGVQLEKASLGLKTAKIQKSTILEQISKTTIKAPFGGIVTAKLSEEGAFAAPGVPLVQITDITMLKFIINVPEGDLNVFTIKQIYRVTADVYPDTALNGTCSMIGSKGNAANSFPVQFTVKNTVGLDVKSGMFGKVMLKKGESEKRIVILASSLVGTTQNPQVYLIKNKRAELHSITVLKRIADKAIVSSGLNQGDILVNSGFINLYDGANVVVSEKGIQ